MPWLILGDSVAGTSHLAREVPCQDAFRVLAFGGEGEWLVISVADGAGSASMSLVGATLVCDAFVRRIQEIPEHERCDQDSIAALFSKVREELLAEAERLGIAARELACTALLAVVGPQVAVFAQVGDGAIVLMQNESYQVVFWPEPGEYANATDFLTDEACRERLQVQVISKPILQIAVFTDGLQRLALDYSSRTAFPGFFAPLFRELRQTGDIESLYAAFRGFLESDRINRRTDDDKTLVLAVRS
jgi:hypothetical protein